MNLVYTHPFSLFSLGLLFVVFVLYLARKPAQSTRASAWLAFLMLVALPWFFTMLARHYGDQNAFWNILKLAVVPFLIWLFILGTTSDEEVPMPGTKSAKAFTKLRPVKFLRVSRPPVKPQQPPLRPLWNAVVTMLLLYALVGIRYGEHLRAKGLITRMSPYQGAVKLAEEHDSTRVIAVIPEQTILRPGEEYCTSLLDGPTAMIDVHVQGETVRRYRISPAKWDGPGFRNANKASNSWICSLYLQDIRVLEVTPETWSAWKDAAEP